MNRGHCVLHCGSVFNIVYVVKGMHMLNDQQLLKLYISLTPRQRDVLQLVSQGLTNQETGKQLFIAPSVVAEHLTCIYETLATHEALIAYRPNRYLLISLYADFMRRHPELRGVMQ